MEIALYHTYILFIIGILIYIFTLFTIKGKIFNLYSNNDYPYNEYKQFWKDMTSEQRLVFSKTYFQFYINLTRQIEYIQGNKTNNNIYFEKYYTYSDFIKGDSKYLNLPFIRVSLIPKSKNFTKKLLVCSHFDGHNLTGGGTAYDDAIHVVSMLGTIDALTKHNFELNTQVDFLFDGSEEYGMMGAYQYVDNLTSKENYDYFNLESMGGSPPYGFVIKSNNGSYRVQKALSKSRGSILMASNYIYATKFTASFTDHIAFDNEGWRGGVSVFLGKGSVYHSKYDKIDNEEDLKIAGNQLLDFVLNYENEGYDGDAVGYGIAPICIVLPNMAMYISIPIIFIISVIVIIWREKGHFKEFFKDLLKEFICFIIIFGLYLLEGFLVYLINPNSPAASQMFIILTSVSGLFYFSLFQIIFKIKKWSRFRLVLNFLIMAATVTTDLSLPFSLLTIFSIIFYAFDKKIVKYISAILQYIVMSLFFTFLIQVFMQYTTRFKEIIGNLVLFVFFFVYSYHVSASPLDLSDINGNKEDGELIDNDLNRNSKEKEKLIDDSTEGKINNDRKSTKSTVKITKKKSNKSLIPVDIIIIYILYQILLLLLFFFKPSPFSKDYTVRGTFLNIFREKENYSSMVFIPLIGHKYVKENIKKSQYYSKFMIRNNITEIVKLGFSGKCYVVDSKDTHIGIFNYDYNHTDIPNRDVFNIDYLNKSSDGRLFDFQFDFNISKSYCINIVYIYIRCKDCIEYVNGKKFNITKDNDNPYHDIALRVGKKEIIDDVLPDFITSTTFTLNTNSFNYTVLLNTLEITKDYYNFLDSFGEASINARSSKVSDTIFLYEGYFSADN